MAEWRDKSWKEQAIEVKRILDALRDRVPQEDVAGQALVFQAREMLLAICQGRALPEKDLYNEPHRFHIKQSLDVGVLTPSAEAWICQEGRKHPEYQQQVSYGRKINAIKELRNWAHEFLEAARQEFGLAGALAPGWEGRKVPDLGLKAAKLAVDLEPIFSVPAP